MAEEPSWEDIFNPNPTPREPVTPTPAPLVEPPQAYPPTHAYPASPAVPPAQEDPFAALFATAEPVVPTQPAPGQPVPQQQYPAQQPPLSPQPPQYDAGQPPYPAARRLPEYPPAQPEQQYPPTQPAGQYPPVQPTQPYPPTQQYPPTQATPPAQQAFPSSQAYPPTQAYPAAPPPSAQPAEEDPFAALFGAQPASPAPAQPVAPVQAAPAQPAAAQPDDPFAGLFGTPEPAAAQPTHEYTPDAPFPTTATARFTPREDDDPFAALFGASAAAAPAADVASSSRRDARSGDVRRRDSDVAGSAPGGTGGGGRDGYGGGSGKGGKPKKKRRLLWLKITLPIVLVLALVGGAAGYGWVNYNEQVRALLGIPLPTDYTGNGNGKEVIITIKSGDIGEDIAHTLHDKGVTLTFDAFYDLLLKQKTDPAFQPGNFKLEQHMSAAAALKALLDPNNKVTDKLLLTEGTTLPDALQTIADTTGISLADLQAASQDLAALGVPTTEHTLEGWLFPATYQLDGGLTAHDVLQLLVNTMIEHLDSAGVAADQRHNVLTLASIIQRESGPNTDDFYKISRVFTNRMEQGINLESDATVAYGTGHLNTVYTTDAERADATNPYNTYANPGYPIGPIGLPGDTAIDAALHPADGPWLFFVPINLQTGETVFSETVDEHDAAVEQLQEWCAASPENDSYCQ